LNKISSGSGSSKQGLTAVGTRYADPVTPLYPRNGGTNLPTGGGRSVGLVRSDCGHGYPWLTGALLVGLSLVSQLQRDGDLSPPSGDRAKNEWSYTLLSSLHVFVARTETTGPLTLPSYVTNHTVQFVGFSVLGGKDCLYSSSKRHCTRQMTSCVVLTYLLSCCSHDRSGT
jgi:hypothetical protein